MNRTVYMGFRSEIHDRSRPVLQQQSEYKSSISYISLDEFVPRVIQSMTEAGHVSRVSEVVEVNYALARFGEPQTHEVAADKAGTAGDKKHGLLPANCPRMSAPNSVAQPSGCAEKSSFGLVPGPLGQ